VKYFTEDELKCQHCGEQGIDKIFMEKVDKLREELGFPFPVTSGYRCSKHPIEARKKRSGAHSTGRAIDIGVSGNKAYRLIKAAQQAGFTGVGVNQKGTGRFIHLDDLEDSLDQPRPWVWSY
jgi:zinc D-Ala-D-Ala carboxypeptidase